MKKLLFLMLPVILFAGILKAQTSHPRNCGTMQYLQYLQSMDPTLEQSMMYQEQKIQEYIMQNEDQLQSSKTVITVPVVVHIVYKTAAQNISDARVLEQIDVLNKDYAGLNIHSMYGFGSTLKVNTELQFCLAQRKADGTATNGIERRQTTVTSFSTNNNVKHFANGGLDAWDPTKYMNIWVCNLGTSLCGYAQFPTSGINSNFGVVINYMFFGVTGAVAPYNLGGTTTHEIGHCFNLYHIWGDDGTSCSGTDNCTDTPNQAGANYGVPAYPHITCTNGPLGDMFMNFMDYSDDIAYTNFTPNQKARIQALFVPGGLLYSLGTSNGCVPPDPNLCNPPTGLAAGSITSSGAVLSWTAATNALSYNLKYKATAASTWTTINTAATTCTLSGLSASTAYEFQVQTVCAAGSSSFTSSTNFTTLSSDCIDNYEANNTLATAKAITVSSNVNALIGTASDVDYFKFNNTSSKKKIKIVLSNLPANYDIRLYKSNGTQVGISQNSGTSTETIIYNTNTVGTYYIKVYGYSGAYNATSCYTLTASISSTNFKGEGLISDDKPLPADLTVAIYPNPTQGLVTLELASPAEGSASVELIDITGRQVYQSHFSLTEGISNHELDLGTLPEGLYFLNVTTPSGRGTHKLILDK